MLRVDAECTFAFSDPIENKVRLVPYITGTTTSADFWASTHGFGFSDDCSAAQTVSGPTVKLEFKDADNDVICACGPDQLTDCTECVNGRCTVVTSVGCEPAILIKYVLGDD